MRTTHCVCFAIDYILHGGGAAEMAGLVRFPPAEAWATESEILTQAAIAQAKGYVVMPSCAHHDERGYCKGHRKA